MNKTFFKLLKEKTKDMGLSDKAINELAELGSANLSEDASDEDVQDAVNSVVPFAKAMQGEYTRKVQAAQSSRKTTDDADDSGDDGKKGNDVPDWFRTYQKSVDAKIAALEGENATLKQAKVKETREAQIAAKAKELGIPSFLIKRMSIADDADIDAELAACKQELVNAKLMPEKSGEDLGSDTEAMKSAAASWAKSLPDL